MANKISVLIDVTIDNAVKSLKGFRTAVSDADGVVNKFKAGAKAGFEAVKANAGLLAAGAGAALLKYGGAIVDAGVQMEALKAKSKTVFGDTLGEVQKWADANAAAMGLTATEAVNAAASMSDLLIPMGFTKEAAADNSLALLDLGGALSAWSGGQRTATEVSQIFTKAMLGEREELKSLGISISEADVQTKLAEKGQKALTGAALAQAKAIATQELIYAKSTDAQRAWTDGSMDGVKAANESKASFTRLQEVLNESLYPALTQLVPVIADTAEGLVPLADSLGTVAAGSIDAAKALGLLASDSDRAYVAFREFKSAFDEAGLDWFDYSTKISIGATTQEDALADLAAAQRANIDITDRAANMADWYKGSVDAATDAVNNLTGPLSAARDMLDMYASKADEAALATQDAEAATRALDDAYNDFIGSLDEEDAFADFQQAMWDYRSEVEHSDQSTRDYKRALADMILELANVPAETKTQMIATLDENNLAAIESRLNIIARNRTVQINGQLVGADLRNAVEGRGATGAIVNRPTVALIGEAGQEAVVPLNRTAGNSPLPSMGGGGIVVNITNQRTTMADRQQAAMQAGAAAALLRGDRRRAG